MVINFFIRFIIVLIIVFNSQLEAANVSVDRSSVRVNETFELTVNMQNTPVNQPEITGMPADLQILRSSNFFRKSTINGESSIQAGWTITIKALSEGLFVIPSFEIDGTMTQPVTIKVLAAVSSANVNGQPDAIKIVSEVDVNSLYVQQQLRYTIRLYRAVRAQYASLTEPQLDGALIERIGDDIQFETTIDSVRYRVLERNYAIFPQQSGIFTVPGVTYSAEVSTSRQSYGTLGSLRGRSRSVSLSSDDITLEVKPIPAANNGWWLPAEELTIEQSWKPDSSRLKVGAPVTWSYTLVAKGLTATQLPDILPPEVAGIKFYPEKAKATNTIVDGELIGKRTQTIAVIATTPGEVAVPAIDINWWNITTDSAETLTLPSRVISVKADTVSQSSPAMQQPPVVVENSAPAIQSSEQILPNSNAEIASDAQDSLLYWQAATALFIILWLTALVKRGAHSAQSHKNARNIASHSSQSDAQSSKAQLTKLLREALKTHNAQRASHALIATARATNPNIHSISDICSSLSDESLLASLKSLERAKYSGDDQVWDADVIKANLTSILAAVSSDVKGGNSKNSQLPPLHATDS